MKTPLQLSQPFVEENSRVYKQRVLAGALRAVHLKTLGGEGGGGGGGGGILVSRATRCFKAAT